MTKFRIGVTGHSGFIGSHLLERFGRDPEAVVVPIDDDYFQAPGQLEKALQGCDCLVDLAGLNRGPEEQVYAVNVALARTLISSLEKLKVKPQVIFASSTYTATHPDSAFGRAKKEAGELLTAWGARNGASVSVLVIPNVFGDGGRPFYNSAVATFCHQLTHGEKPQIIQDRAVEYIYINDLTELIARLVSGRPAGGREIRVPGTKTLKVSELLAILEGFRLDYFTHGVVPVPAEKFERDLYNTFLSYVAYPDYKREPELKQDQRGILFEIVKLSRGGQVFFSTTKPGVIRGNHYHARKIEKFCVLKGSACIRLRKIGQAAITEYNINSDRPAIVDIPIFHAHHIENTGKDDLLTLFWCNEIMDPADADTFHEEVAKIEK
jgi:UDP-2-acetamido-2,6-beta-L-arabino-hexul-4-ose reductase